MTLATTQSGEVPVTATNASQAVVPERRCLVTRETMAKTAMVRFVAGPEGDVVPDVAERLPGRGMWVSAEREAIDAAVKGRLFSRAARMPLTAAPDLADQVAARLAERTLNWIGLARRAGEFVTGHDKVREAIAAGRVGALVQASDGAAAPRGRMRALANTPSLELFTSAELADVTGQAHVVHAALMRGRFADALLTDAARLAGFRPVGETRFEVDSGGDSNKLNG